MYTFALDARASAFVGLKSGASCTDLDYERLIDAHRRFWAEASTGSMAKLVLVIDPGQKPPSPRWRQRMAAIRDQSRPFRSAIVTSSLVERGVITALTWLRPAGPEQKIVAMGTFDEAVAWFEAEVGGCSTLLRSLYAKAREEPKLASSLAST
jgi:hypothetical protein